MRAAIYARVSSQKQADAHSIESQIPACVAFVERNGWTLVDTYRDDGVSASAGNLHRRHDFRRMLDDAEAGRFDVLVVFDLDRITRTDRQRERAGILGTLQDAHVKIGSAREGMIIDLDTDEGDLLAGIGGYKASSWLRRHKANVRNGKDRAIREGRKPAGPTPYGLTYTRATGTWGIHEAEGEIIREIYTRAADGVSLYRIACDLEDRAVPTKRGGRWSRERVWKLVREATYRGEWTADKRQRRTMPVPAIVTDAVWHAAQAALDAYGKRGMKRTRHVYLLEDVGRCALCGGMVCISSACEPRNRPAYYVCHGRLRAKRGATKCALPMLRVEDTDARVWNALRDALATPGNVEAAIDERKRQLREDTRDVGADLVEWRAKLKRATEAEGKLVERFRRGQISDAALDAALDAGRKERALLSMQIAACERVTSSARRDGADADAVLATVATLRTRLDAATPEARRAIVAAVVTGIGDNHVTVGPKTITIHGIVAAEPAVSLARAVGSSYAEQRNEGFTIGLRIVA